MYQQSKNAAAAIATTVQGRPYVFSGPSGSGKSTLLKLLLEEFPGRFSFSVSHTTRQPRPGEVDGVDYHFVSADQMHAAIAAGDFLEHASFAGNSYGTSIAAVRHVGLSGKLCLLDVDRKGVMNLKACAADALKCTPHYVFVAPPNLSTLEARLRARGTETEEKLQARLLRAREDMDFGEEAGVFDLVIVNDELQQSYAQLKAFMREDLK